MKHRSNTRRPSAARRAIDVAIGANSAAYIRARQQSVAGTCWDYLVLTAANERQAAGYRAELELRRRDIGPAGAFFPRVQKTIVVPDPPGKRAGSGGATLGAIQALAKQFNLSPNELAQARICLIHSGGTSMRLPAYSPQGKIFSPLPMLRPDAMVSTLFDHLYITLAGLPDRLGPGMLVMAGDVFMIFDHRQLTAPHPGVTAITMPVEPTVGLGHGVFVTDAQGVVTKTLQKVSIDTMRAEGAVNAHDKILLDTGILFFGPRAMHAMATLSGVGKSKPLQDKTDQQIDLYDEMMAVLASKTEQKPFTCIGDKPIRRELWKHMRGLGLLAMPIDGHFLHLGTTLQFRDAMTGRDHSVAAELFQQNVLTRTPASVTPSARLFASVLLGSTSESHTIGDGAVIEHSILGPQVKVGAGSVVSQVDLPKSRLDLPSESLFFQAPIQTRKGTLLYAQVLCGVLDDFKGKFIDGKCLYLNESIQAFLDRHRLQAKDLWPRTKPADRTLWTAELFPATHERDDAAAAQWLASDRPATKSELSRWKKTQRLSMAQILEQADAAELIAHREVIAATLQTLNLLSAIEKGDEAAVETHLSHYLSPQAYDAARDLILHTVDSSVRSADRKLQSARAVWCLSQLQSRPDKPAGAKSDPTVFLQQRAFEQIAQASEISVENRSFPAESLSKLTPGQTIVAMSPVRLDLAGGWTDAPPYCYERGGAVVNVAINLEGKPPVRATVRTLAEPKLILESVDLGVRSEISEWTHDKPRVDDPVALHRVALNMIGVLPERPNHLAKTLRDLGAGLELITECRVPKGSGLGTSSILAATLLGALYEMAGQKRTTAQIIESTLLLEQRLGTGGGWQDQVGGIVGGIKYTTSTPGLPQSMSVEPLELSDELLSEFESRLVVYFSGHQRLARDILRKVMGRWLAREPAMIASMRALHDNAAKLRTALLAGKWSKVAGEINRYWQLKKELYPGSTTPSVDLIFAEASRKSLAAGLAGAGGGGFGYFFCRDAKQAEKLREFLAERSLVPGSMGAVYATNLNRDGLKITRSMDAR